MYNYMKKISFIFIILFSTNLFAAAPVIDSVGKATANAIPSLTSAFTHTTIGAPTLMVVYLAVYSAAGAPTVSSVAWRGQAMTQINTYLALANMKIEVWGVASPATGVGNVTITCSAVAGIEAASIAYTGTVAETTALKLISLNANTAATLANIMYAEVDTNTDLESDAM